MRTIYLLPLLALLAGTAGYVVHRMQEPAPRTAGAAPDPKAALATLLDQRLPGSRGQLIRLHDWHGMVRVVNYWATWCPPCREEMPVFSELQTRYEAQGVRFVGISIDSIENVQRFEAAEKISYPLVIGNMAAMDIAAALGNPAQGLPFTLVIGRDGGVALVKLGKLSREELEPLLRRLLASPGPHSPK